MTLANSGEFTMDMIAEMLTHKNAAFTKKKYGQFHIAFLTNDESDAVAVFDYWYERAKHGV